MPPNPPNPNPTLSLYLRISALLAVYCLGLWFVTETTQPPPAAEALLSPITALVGLTGVVWLTMVLVRNVTILRGITRADYYHDYQSFTPPEWVERPARAFGNLLEVPILFYLVGVLMLITRQLDRAQLDLAWLFVAMRTVHAVIYLGWNYVPLRFAAWVASCITLGVLWVRFVIQSLPT